MNVVSKKTGMKKLKEIHNFDTGTGFTDLHNTCYTETAGSGVQPLIMSSQNGLWFKGECLVNPTECWSSKI